ncbi:MarR family winged helix-turn-helix transcriptional regulator [Arthrobacter burdickii]|uniref:MarR family transcriptional regulator n=1 Tax=Arthrobacter burdickii TaxID=3035920 RepID=A0ABT8K472_9MICC|nr:MarR family transcriptional regulator [Arthrobacter burdickii]MDN4612249.1 MarR family transcriptional regulator [Arthrobacter burdickii]
MSVEQHTAAELVHNIFDLQRALRGVTTAGMKHSELGPAHTGVLFFIGEGGPMRASALAAKLGVGPSALSRQLADLEQYGFVVRTPDPLDGRACLLSLSGEGQSYLAETYERRAETLREILSDWTEGEAEAASSSVQHLTAALRSAASGAAGHAVLDAPRTPRTTAHHTGNDGRHHLDSSSEIMKEAL